MGHRVSDASRPRRLAKALGRRLDASGHPREPAHLLDLAARLHFYPDHAALVADIGKGPAGLSDSVAGEAETVHRRLLQSAALVADGIPAPLAQETVDALRPTDIRAPRPLARDPVAERLRTAAGVRRALASAGVRAAAGGDLTFSEVAGRHGRWAGLFGSVERDGRREPFCLAVTEDGTRAVASRAPGREPRDLVAARAEGRRDGFHNDLSSVLDLLGYLDAPVANPAPDDVDAVRASRILLRLDSDVLCGLRTLPKLSCEAYELVRAMPDGAGSVRALLREVPLLAGFVMDHCTAVAFSASGTVHDTPLLALIEGPAGLSRGHGRHRVPDAERVGRVVSALSGLDPRLGNRMSLAVVRHLAFLPPDAVPVGAAQAEAMFDAVDALLRFEEAGMRVSRIYEGLEGGDWLGYAARVGAFSPHVHLSLPLFAMLGAAEVGSGALRDLADNLATGFARAYDLDPAGLVDGALSRALAARLAPHVLRNRPLLDLLGAARAYRDAADTHGTDRDGGGHRSGAEAERMLAAAAPLLPEGLRGRDCVAVMAALDYDPASLAGRLRAEPGLRFGPTGEPVRPMGQATWEPAARVTLDAPEVPYRG